MTFFCKAVPVKGAPSHWTAVHFGQCFREKWFPCIIICVLGLIKMNIQAFDKVKTAVLCSLILTVNEDKYLHWVQCLWRNGGSAGVENPEDSRCYMLLLS